MSSRVLVALRVGAAPERAFDVFTRDIGLWWRGDPFFRFTPKGSGALSFEGGEGGRLIETLPGGRVFEIGRILAWSPPERLAFSWRQATFVDGQTTKVEARFEATGDETLVSVEHTGWETVPAGHAARHGLALGLYLTRHGQWWRTLLFAYKARIQSTDLSP